MNYAFLNAEGIVVNLIGGTLTPEQQTRFLKDYAILFGAVTVLEVPTDTTVWIGGSYTDGEFLPPAEPEPVPEPLPEPLPEPEPEPEI